MENINRNDTMPNTTSCVSASPDVRSETPVDSSQAPAEAPQQEIAVAPMIVGGGESGTATFYREVAQ
jgi:hypothetical protein